VTDSPLLARLEPRAQIAAGVVRAALKRDPWLPLKVVGASAAITASVLLLNPVLAAPAAPVIGEVSHMVREVDREASEAKTRVEPVAPVAERRVETVKPVVAHRPSPSTASTSGDCRPPVHGEMPLFENLEPASAADLSLKLPVLGRGARGPFVRVAQALLQRYTHAPVHATGTYDSATADAVWAQGHLSLDHRLWEQLLNAADNDQAYPCEGANLRAQLTELLQRPDAWPYEVAEATPPRMAAGTTPPRMGTTPPSMGPTPPRRGTTPPSMGMSEALGGSGR
jgi:hypothetical protein